ncbi:hypothetical protein SELMODRAFT_417849 [Selaginella moellendorffii]|uniref:Protein kinase domain-containing protein n=1 Tax=Selaginella moellendorffii TaxID=88036 RepID=D8S3U7_SELML|nr:hypothetical protein SELMODRAFT_417849 [Selaginella moellendorffii]
MKIAGEEDLSEVAIERDTELVGFFRLMLSYRRKWKREALEGPLKGFWGRFVTDPTETNILQAIENLRLEKQVTYSIAEMARATNRQFPDGHIFVNDSPRMPAEGKSNKSVGRKLQGELVRLANQYFQQRYESWPLLKHYPVDAWGEGMKSIVWHCANEAYQRGLRSKACVCGVKGSKSNSGSGGGDGKPGRSCVGYVNCSLGDDEWRAVVVVRLFNRRLVVLDQALSREDSTLGDVKHRVPQVRLSVTCSVTPCCKTRNWQPFLEVIGRPAMLIRDAGVALAERPLVSGEEVRQMSKQLYTTLVQVYNVHGICHNDITPGNICCKGGVYRLIDWGLPCGSGLDPLMEAVAKALVTVSLPPIKDWSLSPDCAVLSGASVLERLRTGTTVLLLDAAEWCCCLRNRYHVLCAWDEAIRKMAKDESFMGQHWIFKHELKKRLH